MKRHTEINVPKLSAACFVIGVANLMTCNTLKIIHYPYFPSMTNYGLIFWGNASYSNSLFKIQYNIVRTIISTGTNSCRDLFKMLNINHF